MPLLTVDAAAFAVLVAPMTSVAARKPAKRSLSLPNILTYSRIVAVPVVIGCMYAQSILGAPLWLRWVALFIFIAAGVTDFLDGYYARMWDQQSAFGRMLDPIADKLPGGVVPADAGGGRDDSRLVAVGRHRDSLPRDSGLGSARISRRDPRQRAGLATGEMEDHGSARGHRLSDRG